MKLPTVLLLIGLTHPVIMGCAAAQTYGPPVLDAAMKHFVQVLENKRVEIDQQHVQCDVEINKGVILMLCEAELPKAKGGQP